MLITDDFGDQLFVARPGAIPSAHHEIASDAGGYICLHCHKTSSRPAFSDPCLPTLQGIRSGYGKKADIEKSKTGLFTWFAIADKYQPIGA